MLGPRGGFDCVCVRTSPHTSFFFISQHSSISTELQIPSWETDWIELWTVHKKKKKNLMTTWFLTQFLQQQKKTSHRVAPLIVWLFSQKQFYDLLDRDVLLHVFNESSRSVHCFFSRSERGRPNCTQRVKCHLTWRLCRDLLLKKKKKKSYSVNKYFSCLLYLPFAFKVWWWWLWWWWRWLAAGFTGRRYVGHSSRVII